MEKFLMIEKNLNKKDLLLQNLN